MPTTPPRSAERADRLFKRLKASRLDNSHGHEMRRLVAVDLLIVDDVELVIEGESYRRRQKPTITKTRTDR